VPGCLGGVGVNVDVTDSTGVAASSSASAPGVVGPGVCLGATNAVTHDEELDFGGICLCAMKSSY
jgi:hypothetical protein